MLRDDRRPRLREADRLGSDAGGLAERARHQRLSRHRGGRCDGDRDRSRTAARGALRRARRANGRPRGVSRRPAGRGHDAPRPERRRQVDPRARDRGNPASERWQDPARRRRPHTRATRGDPVCGRRHRPRRAQAATRTDGGGQPARRDLHALARRAQGADRVRARALPATRGALEGALAPALGRRAADGRACPGPRLAPADRDRRRALAGPGADRREEPRADARGSRRAPGSGSC